ncbi:Oidioi.mRNA.OKI2018_I69.PAR.g8662.t1.cds [Oikopleura dioica]|uniref:Oidioi.mRNA.OKI2018_I69.PAR.g8662.t1.cds n=1 Tax=Oikopleura dioica TaxID=34765 RepID=A0ABN7RKL0_OIKDI|nr:Oidioi.mRNA.OKI2018_I69.PAR.g8662.t1.cds [Oikopleura dioica]
MQEQRCKFCGDDLVEMFKRRCCGASEELVDRLRRDVHIDESDIFNPRFIHTPPVEKRNLQASSWKGHDSIHIERLSDGFKMAKWDANQFLKTWKHTAIPRAGTVRSSLYNECCGDSSCSSQKILDSSINQECCGVGCRYEEVLETCGAVKWVPMK